MLPITLMGRAQMVQRLGSTTEGHKGVIGIYAPPRTPGVRTKVCNGDRVRPSNPGRESEGV